MTHALVFSSEAEEKKFAAAAEAAANARALTEEAKRLHKSESKGANLAWKQARLAWKTADQLAKLIGS